MDLPSLFGAPYGSCFSQLFTTWRLEIRHSDVVKLSVPHTALMSRHLMTPSSRPYPACCDALDDETTRAMAAMAITVRHVEVRGEEAGTPEASRVMPRERRTVGSRAMRALGAEMAELARSGAVPATTMREEVASRRRRAQAVSDADGGGRGGAKRAKFGMAAGQGTESDATRAESAVVGDGSGGGGGGGAGGGAEWGTDGGLAALAQKRPAGVGVSGVRGAEGDVGLDVLGQTLDGDVEMREEMTSSAAGAAPDGGAEEPKKKKKQRQGRKSSSKTKGRHARRHAAVKKTKR